MSKFIYLYKGPATPMDQFTEQQSAAQIAAWNAWTGRSGLPCSTPAHRSPVPHCGGGRRGGGRKHRTGTGTRSLNPKTSRPPGPWLTATRSSPMATENSPWRSSSSVRCSLTKDVISACLRGAVSRFHELQTVVEVGQAATVAGPVSSGTGHTLGLPHVHL